MVTQCLRSLPRPQPRHPEPRASQGHWLLRAAFAPTHVAWPQSSGHVPFPAWPSLSQFPGLRVQEEQPPAPYRRCLCAGPALTALPGLLPVTFSVAKGEKGGHILPVCFSLVGARPPQVPTQPFSPPPSPGDPRLLSPEPSGCPQPSQKGGKLSLGGGGTTSSPRPPVTVLNISPTYTRS